MDVYKLAAILSLEDRLSGPMAKAQGAAIAAGAAVAGAGLKIGADWASATKTIVDGTGATGAGLEQLQTDFQAVAKHGANEAATAIADLNTHLGISGPELQSVADKALKMGANTNFVGETLGHVVKEGGSANAFLDVFDAGLKSSGVGADRMARQINKAIPEFADLGFSAEETTAHVIELANKYGHQGLIPALVASKAELREGGTVLGDYSALAVESAGSIEKGYEASYTWRDAISEVKNATIAYLGPAGDMLAGVGGLAVGVATMGPHLATMASKTGLVTGAQKLLNVALTLNPIGLVIAAVGALVAVYLIWSDEINAFLRGAWNGFLGAVEGGIDLLRPLASVIGIELPENLDSYKFATDDAAGSTTSATAEIAALKDEASATAPVLSGTLAPAVVVVKDEIEAFDLATVSLRTQLQQAAPEIKNIGDLLEASGLQAGAAVVPWGFFADETSVKVPNAMDIVMDSIMKVPPTAEEVAQQLRVIAPTWGQGLVDGLKTVWNPTNVSATLSHAFTSGGGFLDAAKALGAQAGGVLMDKVGNALSAMGPWGQAAAAALPAAILLGKKIWSGITSAFGGPSEEVQAARGDLDAFAGDVESRIGQTASSTERYQDFIAHGWEENRALVITFFQDQAIAAGQSAQAGTDHFTKYQDRDGSRQRRAHEDARAAGARLERRQRGRDRRARRRGPRPTPRRRSCRLRCRRSDRQFPAAEGCRRPTPWSSGRLWLTGCSEMGDRRRT